jgi:hypothetical protein
VDAGNFVPKSIIIRHLLTARAERLASQWKGGVAVPFDNSRQLAGFNPFPVLTLVESLPQFCYADAYNWNRSPCHGQCRRNSPTAGELPRRRD